MKQSKIKWKQANLGFENFGLDYGNPDFVEYANSYGAKGYRVASIDEFKKTVTNCLKSNDVSLIEVPIDYSQNGTQLTKNLAQKTCLS